MNTQSSTTSYVFDILSRIVGPDEGNLTHEAAQGNLQLRFDDHDRRRAHELATKSQAQDLDAGELEEIEAYRRVGRLLDLLQSKARRSLKRSESDRLIHSDE